MSIAPTLLTLELHITYRCNKRCLNCSNLITQAPARHDLSIEDIEKALSSNHHWGMITVHGGEPVCHPQFIEIAKYLKEYGLARGTNIWWLTNDELHDRVYEIDRLGISLGRARKYGEQMYVPVTRSPTDLNEPFDNFCFQLKDCGIAYNYLGFWPCSPMASAARVFGYKPMCLSADDLTVDLVLEKCKEHCKHCGFAGNAPRTREAQITDTWREKLEVYNG